MKPILKSLTVLSIMLLMTLPWAIRNYRFFNCVVPYTASSYYIYDGFNSSVKHGYETCHPLKPGDKDFDPVLEKAKIENDVKVFQKRAKKGMYDFLTKHPGQAFRLMVEREWAFLVYNPTQLGCWARRHIDESNKFRPELQSSHARKLFVGATYLGSYYLLFGLFLYGLMLSINEWNIFIERAIPLTILYLCMGLYCLEQAIIYPDWKYRYPLEVLMIPFAAYGIERIIFNLNEAN